MINMHRYIRNKLLHADPLEQQVFIKHFTNRAIKSMSLASGVKVHSHNRWFRIINFIESGYPEFKLAQRIADACIPRIKAAPKGAKRLRLVALAIQASHGDSSSTNLSMLFQDQEALFEGDTGFLYDFASRSGHSRRSCGHFSEEHVEIRGDENGIYASTQVCPHCADILVRAGKHVRATHLSNVLYLAEFVVSATDANGATILIDQRHPNYRFDERRQHYVHINWSPYQNLIDSYHSSKAKGFSVIDSPWFRSHRRAFGCELEVQVRQGDCNAAAGRVHELLNPSGDVGEYCFFERDSSIGTGFEMVTQPAGLDVHRDKFALFLNNPEVKRGMRSHEGGSCGFHVHVGRQYLTQSQIYRIQSFLNDVRNEALIKKIARRYSTGYSKIKYEMGKISPHNKTSGDRYEALNVTGRETVEFRIFRGSLRYESIMAALEFVNAVLDFCQPGAVSIMEFNSIGFQRFLMHPNNRTDTKYLRSYLSLDADRDNEQRAA